MRSAAIAIDCRPDEQKRLMVIALVSTGRPARIAAARATFMPCSASGIAQPMITSSISDVAKPGTRATASLITAAPISSGRVVRKVPLGALPTAVRTDDTITASLMILVQCPTSNVQRPMSNVQRADFGLSTLDHGLSFSIQRPMSNVQMSNVQTLDFRLWTMDLVSQWFPRLQHVRHSLLRLACTNQREKILTLQIQQILF